MESENTRAWTALLDEAVAGLAWSPDGRALAAASVAGPIHLLDVATGQVLFRLPGHKRGTLAVVWSAAGGLASGGQDGKVLFWNPATGDLTRELEAGGRWVEHLVWSPDGKSLASSAGKMLRVWNAAGELQFEFGAHESTVSALQWRPDGRGIATSCYGGARLFRLGEREPYEHLKWKTSLICLAWSPGGRYVAAGTQESTVKFWRLPFGEGEPLEMSGYPAKVKNLAWDRQGQFLATDGGEIITVWDVSGKGPAGRKPIQIKAHEARVSCLAYQTKGDWLASGDEAGQIAISRATTSASPRKLVTMPATITELRWSADEQRLAAGTQDGSVTVTRL